MKNKLATVAVIALMGAAMPLSSAHAYGWHEGGWGYHGGGWGYRGGGLVVGAVAGIAGAAVALATAPFQIAADLAAPPPPPRPVYYAPAPVYYGYGYGGPVYPRREYIDYRYGGRQAYPPYGYR